MYSFTDIKKDIVDSIDLFKFSELGTEKNAHILIALFATDLVQNRIEKLRIKSSDIEKVDYITIRIGWVHDDRLRDEYKRFERNDWIPIVITEYTFIMETVSFHQLILSRFDIDMFIENDLPDKDIFYIYINHERVYNIEDTLDYINIEEQKMFMQSVDINSLTAKKCKEMNETFQKIKDIIDDNPYLFRESYIPLEKRFGTIVKCIQDICTIANTYSRFIKTLTQVHILFRQKYGPFKDACSNFAIPILKVKTHSPRVKTPSHLKRKVTGRAKATKVTKVTKVTKKIKMCSDYTRVQLLKMAKATTLNKEISKYNKKQLCDLLNLSTAGGINKKK